MSSRVLVVDDQANVRELLQVFLQSQGLQVNTAEDGETALTLLNESASYTLVLLDLDFGPGKMHGLDVLKVIRQEYPHQPVIILTGQATISTAVEAMHLGAQDFVEKDLYIEENLERALRYLEEVEREKARKKTQEEDERRRLKRIEQELEEAKSIQRAILPSAHPSFAGLGISNAFFPASEIGGDYYDFLPLSETCLAIAIGDAQGHGLPAGLLVSAASGALHTSLESTHSMGAILKAMNRRFFGLKERTFMTFCLTAMDIQNCTATLATAGHHFPYHYSSMTGTLVGWDAEGSFPLGVEPVGRFPILTHPLASGDLFVFYSDGLVEALNPAQEDFGHHRLEQLILKHVHQTARQIQEAILEAFWTHHQQDTLNDDITLIVVKID